MFGTTVDSKLTDIIKSTKTNPRVLNLINHTSKTAGRDRSVGNHNAKLKSESNSISIQATRLLDH